MSKHIIKSIEKDSIAEELELMPGDELISINGQEIEDVLDYRYIENDEEIELIVYRSSTNEEWELFIEKEAYDTLGIEFESGLMDDYKSCHNKCVFCFIDQLPPGMRETMYFKDDDARLSFLQGNYITMTNMKDKDFRRIIEYKLSPINISIHTMNMELRKAMLHNRFADKLIDYMDQLYAAGITMNGQIVLCKGINDQEELDYSIREMYQYAPHLQSVSIVPVGLSKYRDHLEKLEPFTSEDAKQVVELVEKYQRQFYEQSGSHFIHAADEFYFLAGQDVPSEKTYDGYLQYENGVGMTRLLKNEFQEAIKGYSFDAEKNNRYKKISMISGKLFQPVMEQFSMQVRDIEAITTQTQVFGIENNFFGPRITVSGLVTGQDIIKQCATFDLGECVYIPDNMLKSDEEIFLDDITLEELSEALNTKVVPIRIDGTLLFNVMTGKEIEYE